MEKKTTKKFKEDALVTENQPQAMPAAQPATADEVANATATTTPMENNLPEATAEEPTISTPQEQGVPSADPFTPPAPGMIPSGWVKPEDLASALAQETGDMEVASTAEDAMVTDQPVPTESAVQQAENNEEEFIPSAEEKEVIMEYRKYKASLGKKLVEDKDPITGVEYDDKKDDDKKDGEEEVSVEKVSDEINDIIDNNEEVNVDYNITPLEDGDVDDDEVEINADLMDTINDFISELGFEDEEEDENINEDEDDISEMEDETEDTVTTLKATSNFLNNLADDLEDDFDDDEDIPEDEEEDTAVEEVLEDIPEEDNELDEENIPEEEETIEETIEESIKKIHKDSFKEASSIIYPAGSSPLENDSYKSSIKNTKDNLEIEDNLVRSYEKSSAEKRRALKNYRENLLRENRNPARNNDPRFREALTSNIKITSENKKADPKAWSSNKFFEKYEESKSFSFQKLLEDGFLG